MRVLTVQQPWATLIMRGHKNIENRSWRPRSIAIGERFAIHAGRHYDEDAIDILEGIGASQAAIDEAVWARSSGCDGCILGTVRLIGVVEKSAYIWFVGPVGWVLGSPVEYFAPIPCVGKQSLWDMPVAALLAASSVGQGLARMKTDPAGELAALEAEMKRTDT